jgi:hypothetical protein
MNVAVFQNGSYQQTYAIGDQIRIGGYTPPEFNDHLNDYAGLGADFINGLHTIGGFHTSPDPTSDHHYSFDVILPDFTGNNGVSQPVQAWTQPNSV